MRKERGITLIALIITIIILLILAMVTIRILMNQGIIKHAQNATAAYNDAQNNETEYLTYAEGEMDKYAGGSGSGSGDTYTPPAEDVDALRKYFLGTKEDGSINEEGQSLMTHSSDCVTWDDDEATIGSGSNILMFMYPYLTVKNEQGYYYFYVKYKNQDAYRLELDLSFNVKDVVFVYNPQGEEGETKEYKNNATGETEQWTVLYDKGNTLELVSPKIIAPYALGRNDGGVSQVGMWEDKAMRSYNNSVTNLNLFCRSILSDETARCVGSNSANPDSDNPGMYTSENLASWAEGAYNGVGKNGDENAEQDFVRMVYHGVIIAKDTEGNDTDYWLASRLVAFNSDNVDFAQRYVSKKGDATGYNYLLRVSSNNEIETPPYSLGVRPCVTVPK